MIANGIKEFETNKSETIYLEITTSNKKWLINIYVYRSPNETNEKVFFDELFETLDKAVNSYDKMFIAGNLNIDTGDKSEDANNYLCDFMDSFSLSNLIKVKTCCKSGTCTILDIILTNKMRSIQKSSTVTTGISDCHKMIVTCIKAHLKKLPAKKTVYRDYKNFNKNTFPYDLDQNLMQGKFYSQKHYYNLFIETFKSVVDHHAPLKNKFVRGNDAPFITKHLRKAIMNRSRSKHKYLKFPSRENFLAMKSIKNAKKQILKRQKQKISKNVRAKVLQITNNSGI